MSYGIRITGLKEAQRLLGADVKPALGAATLAIGYEVQGTIAPYPPATVANSPDNPKGKWYERGYGPKWQTRQGVHGRKTSQMLGRRWAVRKRGLMQATVGNSATYAPYVHSAEQQAAVHAQHKWVTDQQAVEAVIRSGVVARIVKQAIVGALRKR